MKNKRRFAAPVVTAALLFCLAACDTADDFVFVGTGGDASATAAEAETNFSVETVSRIETGDPVVIPVGPAAPSETVKTVGTAEPSETAAPSETAKPSETAAPPETERLPETSPETAAPPETAASEGITAVSLTETVSPGGKASLTIRGKPGVTYTIRVRYPSGVSTAKGLEPKTADEAGLVTWEWRVGTRTKAGRHGIEVSGGGETLTLSFSTI